VKRALFALSYWLLAPAAFAILDTNDNGVSDFWEREFNNGNLFDEFFEPHGDSDADGWTNAQEAEAGTNPFDPNPPDGMIRPVTDYVPAVIVEENGVPDVKTPEAVKVTWPTLAGKQYTMYFSPDLTQGSWLPVGSPFIAQGGVSEYGFQELSVADKRFWRVAVEDIDEDSDGLTNHEEFLSGTNPMIADTDGDTLSDHVEMIEGTDPNHADVDYDGMEDRWETAHGLDPADWYDAYDDTDGDGIQNQFEYVLGFHPTVANPAELTADRDNDGMPDFWEAQTGSFQWSYATQQYEFKRMLDWDNTADAVQDLDSDDLANLAEYQNTTDPIKHDTDGDGMPDGWEIQHSLNAKDATGINGTTGDPDNDGLDNFNEWLNGCDPANSDSDHDSISDGIEVNQGSDPNNPSDGGSAPPVDQMVDVPFTVSDPSGSHSEKWKLMIRGLGPDDNRILNLASPSFGNPASATFKLRKGNRYEVSVSHLATDPDYLENYNQADYDWEATVDGKPATTSMESIDGIPGVNNYFAVKGHWIADNRQAVFTTEKHGNDENIVTGHTAILIPALERDKDAIDNNWQPIAGELAKALPGQKINLRLNPSILGYGFASSNPHWSISQKIFKDYVADENSAILTEIKTTDLTNLFTSFYFADSGSKSIILSVFINNEQIQLTDTINVEEPVSTFQTTLGEVRFQTDVAYFNLGLHSNSNSPLGGLGMHGSVSTPQGEPQGIWHWVQLGKVERSKTNSDGVVFQFSMNGIKALDTSYGYSADYATDGNQKSISDSPAMICVGWQSVSAQDDFDLYQMFRPHGTESRFVPLAWVAWGWNGTAIKSSSGNWSFSTASPAYCDAVNKTAIHPVWDKNLVQGVQPGP
jgi:hypothetical protein